jgi:hypothetical protein
MTTSEEAQRTKYRAIVGCVLALVVGGLLAFSEWCKYAYSNVDYAERYRRVLHQQENIEQRITSVEQFVKSLNVTLEWQKKIPKEQ